MSDTEKIEDAASIVDSTTIADVYRADKQLAGIVKKTKLIPSDFFSEQCGNTVYLKPENMQHTGAFKLQTSRRLQQNQSAYRRRKI